MHYQAAPNEEDKLVRCTKGALNDIIVDLRPESDTFKQWISVELSAENRRMIYVPKGFAHGFITLQSNTEIFYLMSQFYAPGHSSGFRWNDAAFGLEWPEPITVISEQDRNYPDFSH